MRKIIKLTCAFSCASAIGLAIDLNIDTGPLVCTVDPTCRKLTREEISEAKEIFGDKIAYNRVRVFERLILYTPALNLILNTDAKAQSMHSNIYTPTNDNTIRTHELAHVWQKQNNIPHIMGKNQERQYDLSDKESFYDMGREQQAEIIEFYFDLTQRLNQPVHNPALKRGLCALLDQHRAILGPVLPVSPHPACKSS